MSNYLSVSTTLKRTKAYIEQPRVWIKGQMFWRRKVGSRTVDSVCLLGGLDYVSRKAHKKTNPLARGFLTEIVPTSSVIQFNDSPGTKKKDVLSFLDNAIAEAERRGI